MSSELPLPIKEKNISLPRFQLATEFVEPIKLKTEETNVDHSIMDQISLSTAYISPPFRKAITSQITRSEKKNLTTISLSPLKSYEESRNGNLSDQFIKLEQQKLHSMISYLLLHINKLTRKIRRNLIKTIVPLFSLPLPLTCLLICYAVPDFTLYNHRLSNNRNSYIINDINHTVEMSMNHLDQVHFIDNQHVQQPHICKDTHPPPKWTYFLIDPLYYEKQYNNKKTDLLMFNLHSNRQYICTYRNSKCLERRRCQNCRLQDEMQQGCLQYSQANQSRLVDFYRKGPGPIMYRPTRPLSLPVTQDSANGTMEQSLLSDRNVLVQVIYPINQIYEIRTSPIRLLLDLVKELDEWVKQYLTNNETHFIIKIKISETEFIPLERMIIKPNEQVGEMGRTFNIIILTNSKLFQP